MRNAAAPVRNTWATYSKAARETLGLTPGEAADKLGVSRTTVWRWESGKATPDDPAFVHAYAAAFGVDPDEALAAAGLKPNAKLPAHPTYEPPLDPDVRILMRKLADPATNEATRAYIRRTLHILASLDEVGPEFGQR